METCWIHSGDTLDTRWRQGRDTLETRWRHNGDMMETCWRHAGDKAETRWRHAHSHHIGGYTQWVVPLPDGMAGWGRGGGGPLPDGMTGWGPWGPTPSRVLDLNRVMTLTSWKTPDEVRAS
ncbi:unnamed protein product [Pleuronectes platessa]|uniref:Uncharacterized protein n=1 Tax=Pleuronectes platessa TaxID=8262 RepID=A0A9N7TTI3_PLEPL|nr:unnamed protein product [Pleuronectes platessa]